MGWGVSTLVFMCNYTWYAAGVLMCTHGTWGGVGWGFSTLVFMCTHGTLLVC